ncbi:hypothetical protein FHETE_1884 [Fusarium heterosporum]|uniref:Uncharacterized protein n=1 Tax=Fusarium heterosporum TaxID=42747 RepID=A0A8H5WZ32_FUSHE|nr:hypothetical protein FHETE_1884 [Fusarium heterosporum]
MAEQQLQSEGTIPPSGNSLSHEQILPSIELLVADIRANIKTVEDLAKEWEQMKREHLTQNGQSLQEKVDQMKEMGERISDRMELLEVQVTMAEAIRGMSIGSKEKDH